MRLARAWGRSIPRGFGAHKGDTEAHQTAPGVCKRWLIATKRSGGFTLEEVLGQWCRKRRAKRVGFGCLVVSSATSVSCRGGGRAARAHVGDDDDDGGDDDCGGGALLLSTVAVVVVLDGCSGGGALLLLPCRGAQLRGSPCVWSGGCSKDCSQSAISASATLCGAEWDPIVLGYRLIFTKACVLSSPGVSPKGSGHPPCRELGSKREPFFMASVCI